MLLRSHTTYRLSFQIIARNLDQNNASSLQLASSSAVAIGIASFFRDFFCLFSLLLLLAIIQGGALDQPTFLRRVQTRGDDRGILFDVVVFWLDIILLKAVSQSLRALLDPPLFFASRFFLFLAMSLVCTRTYVLVCVHKRGEHTRTGSLDDSYFRDTFCPAPSALDERTTQFMGSSARKEIIYVTLGRSAGKLDVM